MGVVICSACPGAAAPPGSLPVLANLKPNQFLSTTQPGPAFPLTWIASPGYPDDGESTRAFEDPDPHPAMSAGRPRTSAPAKTALVPTQVFGPVLRR